MAESEPRLIPCANYGSVAIPAGGLAQPNGTDSEGRLMLVTPGTANQAGLVVVYGSTIPELSNDALGRPFPGNGNGTYDTCVILAYDPAGGIPAVGDTLGSQAGEFLALVGNTGFQAIDGGYTPFVNAIRDGTVAQYRTKCVSGVNVEQVSYDGGNTWGFSSFEGFCGCDCTCSTCLCTSPNTGDGGTAIPSQLFMMLYSVGDSNCDITDAASCQSYLCQVVPFTLTGPCVWCGNVTNSLGDQIDIAMTCNEEGQLVYNLNASFGGLSPCTTDNNYISNIDCGEPGILNVSSCPEIVSGVSTGVFCATAILQASSDSNCISPSDCGYFAVVISSDPTFASCGFGTGGQPCNPCVPPPPPIIGYDCISGVCIAQYSGSPEYATEAECVESGCRDGGRFQCVEGLCVPSAGGVTYEECIATCVSVVQSIALPQTSKSSFRKLANTSRNGTSLEKKSSSKTRPPCAKLGKDTGKKVECKTCKGTVSLKVLECSEFGICTIGKRADGVLGCCEGCTKYEAPMISTEMKVALHHPNPSPAPWNYDVSICIPHLDTPDLLELNLAMWRCQTVRPYFIIVDTGSPPGVIDRISRLRGSDCEVHCIQKTQQRHPSSCVATALDLAHATCKTTHLFHTHTDVFPRKRNFLEWLIPQCTQKNPVVGWRMSPRNHGNWSEAVSHTATMIHIPFARSQNLTWSLDTYLDIHPTVRPPWTGGWPDTETGFWWSMVRAGLVPMFLGDETNHKRQLTEWWDHSRSFTCLKNYSGPTHDRAMKDIAIVLQEARERLSEWEAESLK